MFGTTQSDFSPLPLPGSYIWKTNHERLIERAFEAIDRPIDSISGTKDLVLRATPGAARLYKMHGSIGRLDDVVISTGDYELYRSTRAAYLPLLQAHITSMSMLFVGLSFTDPNLSYSRGCADRFGSAFGRDIGPGRPSAAVASISSRRIERLAGLMGGVRIMCGAAASAMPALA